MSDAAKEKPRLTEQEKKNNHIASEQKRRQAIREGFDRLANLVPGMDGQGRSESLVLNSAIVYMKEQIDEYHKLMAQAKAMGLETSDIEIPDMEPPPENNGVRGNGHGGASGAGNGHADIENSATTTRKVRGLIDPDGMAFDAGEW